MHGRATVHGRRGSAALLLALAVAPLSACADIAAGAALPLAEQCRAQGGVYGPSPTEPARVGARYSATLPPAPGCLLRLGRTTVFRLEVAPGAEAAPPHFANLAFGELDQPGFGPTFSTLAELRRLLEEDARGAVARGGTGRDRGQVIRALQPQGYRLMEAEIGPDLVAQGCIPVRLRSEAAAHPAFPPGAPVELRGQELYCVAGPGETANFHFVEIFGGDDAAAERRGARARALAAQFFASVRLESGPAAPAEPPADVHCRLAYRGVHHAAPMPPFRALDFTVTIPGTGWCETPIRPGMATLTLDLPQNEDPAASAPATAADRLYMVQLSVLRLGPDDWGGGRRTLRNLADLRVLLDGIVRRVRGGSITYAPPVSNGRAELRWIEIGADMPQERCIPVRMEHETRDRQIVPENAVLVFRAEYRYCLGPGGVTALLVARDRVLEGDPHRAARTAQLQAIANSFFASLRWSP